METEAERAPRTTLWNRVAPDPVRGTEVIWLDLADSSGSAVRIDKDGWTVQRAPALFHRFSHQLPLPMPLQGGDLRGLLPYLNLRSEADQVLFLASMVVALLPNIPQPILILHGPQGAAKTTAARMRRALIDPSLVKTVLVRRDLAELVQALDHHYMPILDNLTNLAPWQEEVLCQAATGAAFTKRRLFTDGDDVMRKQGMVAATATELAGLLGNGSFVPRQPAVLGRRLNCLRAPLLELGIVVYCQRGKPPDRQRTWILAGR